MLSSRMAFIQDWLNARNKRERILVVIVGCAIIYMFWFFLLSRPIVLEQRALQSRIFSLKTSIHTAHADAETIKTIATRYSTNQKLQTQKSLAMQSEDLQKFIETSAYHVSVIGNIESVLKDILNQPSKGVFLVNIKNLSSEPLIGNAADTKGLPAIIKKISKHGVQIQIQSDFFNTIYFLNQLEKLSWRLYWDSIDYKVLEYPKAAVDIKFYVLVNERGN